MIQDQSQLVGAAGEAAGLLGLPAQGLDDQGGVEGLVGDLGDRDLAHLRMDPDAGERGGTQRADQDQALVAQPAELGDEVRGIALVVVAGRGGVGSAGGASTASFGSTRLRSPGSCR